MAEREGFEPSVEFPLHTLSKRAPSTTRTSLRAWRARPGATAGFPPAARLGSLRYARTSLLAPLRSLTWRSRVGPSGRFAPPARLGSLRYARTSLLAPLRSLTWRSRVAFGDFAPPARLGSLRYARTTLLAPLRSLTWRSRPGPSGRFPPAARLSSLYSLPLRRVALGAVALAKAAPFRSRSLPRRSTPLVVVRRRGARGRRLAAEVRRDTTVRLRPSSIERSGAFRFS